MLLCGDGSRSQVVGVGCGLGGGDHRGEVTSSQLIRVPAVSVRCQSPHLIAGLRWCLSVPLFCSPPPPPPIRTPCSLEEVLCAVHAWEWPGPGSPGTGCESRGQAPIKGGSQPLAVTETEDSEEQAGELEVRELLNGRCPWTLAKCTHRYSGTECLRGSWRWGREDAAWSNWRSNWRERIRAE